MADENQELQRMAEELRNAFQGLDTATKNANVGLQAFGKELKTVPGQLAKGLGGLASSVAKGDTSLKSMSAVVDVAANAISGLAKTVPIFGEAMSAATKAVAEGAKIVVDQLDQTAKTFNAMSASGALVADGMTGLGRQFTTAGLNLQQFQKVVGQNSVALARFRGLAGDGAEEFSKVVGNLTKEQDTGLRKIGMSAEDISSTTASFVTQQTRLGKSQAMSTDQLTAGSKQYALELDLLSKVTGMSRAEIQKQQDAALSEGKFRANYDELVNSGKEKEAKALMNLQTRMQSFGAELGQGTRDLASGAANTDAAKKMVASTGGAALDIIARLKDGSIDENQAQKELQDAYKRQKSMLMQNAKYMGDSNESLNAYSQVSDFTSADIEKNGMKAKAVQDAQIDKTDALTKSTVKAQQNIEKMNTKFSELALELMPLASDAIEEMTSAMIKLVDWANKTFGNNTAEVSKQKRAEQAKVAQAAPAGETNKVSETMVTNTEGGAAMVFRGRKDKALDKGSSGPKVDKSGEPAATTPAAPAATVAPKPAPAAPAATAPNATAPAATTPAAPAAPAAAGGGPPSVNLKDFIKFTGGTGSEAHFNQLLPSIQDNFMRMAQDYNNLTGKKLQVNSAFRTPEEQANVDPGTNPKAAPGMSKHNIGRAIDIQSGQRTFLEQNGMLSTYGFSPLPGDPPHISAANGAILSGPTGGYQPNLTMHGTEAIVPLNSPTAQSMGIGSGENTSLMTAQLEKLEEMVSVMKNQLDVSKKIMSYAS
jgi:hypothetical protein